MKPAARAPQTEAEVWLSILYPDRVLTPRAAWAILGLSIPDGDAARMRELSAKARAGTLTAEEDADMDAYERVGSVLSILKSKARLAQKRLGRSA